MLKRYAGTKKPECDGIHLVDENIEPNLEDSNKMLRGREKIEIDDIIPK
jgi:hypothetical protein